MVNILSFLDDNDEGNDNAWARWYLWHDVPIMILHYLSDRVGESPVAIMN